MPRNLFLALACAFGVQSAAHAVLITATPVTQPNLPGAAYGVPASGLQGFYWSSNPAGTVAGVQNLIGTNVTPSNTWTNVGFTYAGQADSAGLFNFLGSNATNVTGVNDPDVSNSGFAFRGYINITQAMDLTPGGTIDIELTNSSDDASQYFIGNGPNATGGQAFGGTNTLSFNSPGLYRFDLLFQEGGGNTNLNLAGRFANLNGGVNTNLSPAAIASFGSNPLFFQSADFPLLNAPEPSSILLMALVLAPIAGWMYLRQRRLSIV